jgi:hypothetical protein
LHKAALHDRITGFTAPTTFPQAIQTTPLHCFDFQNISALSDPVALYYVSQVTVGVFCGDQQINKASQSSRYVSFHSSMMPHHS